MLYDSRVHFRPSVDLAPSPGSGPPCDGRHAVQVEGGGLMNGALLGQADQMPLFGAAQGLAPDATFRNLTRGRRVGLIKASVLKGLVSGQACWALFFGTRASQRDAL